MTRSDGLGARRFAGRQCRCNLRRCGGRGPHQAHGGCVTLDERTRRALTHILGFADEMSEYVTSLGEQNLYDHRQTQLIAEALLHRIGEAVSRLEYVLLRSTLQSNGKR